MIFFFDAKIKDIDSYDKKVVKNLFRNLIDADRLGNHYFVLSTRRLIIWALENLYHEDDRDYGHLERIYEEFSFRKALLKDAKKYLKIILGNESIKNKKNKIFTIGHEKFINGKYSKSESVLVLESTVYDEDFYAHVFEKSCALTRVPLSYSFDPVHGGGNTTGHVFCKEIKKTKIVTCLFDSDKNSPYADFGDTAKGVLDVCKKQPHFVGYADCHAGREMENIIPYEIAKKIIGEKTKHKDYVDTISKLDMIVSHDSSSSNTNRFWLFYDIKKGLVGKAIKENCDKITNKSKKQTKLKNIKWMRNKLQVTDNDFQRLVLKGFGSKLVMQLLEDEQLKREFEDFICSDYWKDVFLETFEIFLWFFAAPNKIAAT